MPSWLRKIDPFKLTVAKVFLNTTTPLPQIYTIIYMDAAMVPYSAGDCRHLTFPSHTKINISVASTNQEHKVELTFLINNFVNFQIKTCTAGRFVIQS